MGVYLVFPLFFLEGFNLLKVGFLNSLLLDMLDILNCSQSVRLGLLIVGWSLAKVDYVSVLLLCSCSFSNLAKTRSRRVSVKASPAANDNSLGHTNIGYRGSLTSYLTLLFGLFVLLLLTKTRSRHVSVKASPAANDNSLGHTNIGYRGSLTSNQTLLFGLFILLLSKCFGRSSACWSKFRSARSLLWNSQVLSFLRLYVHIPRQSRSIGFLVFKVAVVIHLVITVYSLGQVSWLRNYSFQSLSTSV